MYTLANSPVPPHLALARREHGVKEAAGGAHHPRILEYHQATDLRATTDEVPWCAAFVSWVLRESGLPSTRSAAAISYATYGEPLNHPEKGCIAVFRRSGGHHVGFVEDYDATHVLVLGGNQGNAVSTAKYSRADLIGFRAVRSSSRPATATPLPQVVSWPPAVAQAAADNLPILDRLAFWFRYLPFPTKLAFGGAAALILGVALSKPAGT
jgi:uncharacterized protein (TIGR02594 family)